MTARRIVTGVGTDGLARIVSDGPVPRAHDFKSIPGYHLASVWAIDDIPLVPNAGQDRTATMESIFPSSGGIRVAYIESPPRSVYASASFDREAANHELADHAPGLLQYLEKESRFHATPTVDCMIMLEGEIWLILDDGSETCIRSGDIVVQNGTRHAWENRSRESARYVAIAIGGVDARN